MELGGKYWYSDNESEQNTTLIMWSLCIVESTVLAGQTKKLSFDVRDEFCQRYKMPGGTNFFRAQKFQVKSGPQKSPNVTACRVSHPNF